MIRKMDMVLFISNKEIYMAVNGRIMLCREMESIYSKIVIFIMGQLKEV
jgi:hypothetical protein